MREINRKLKRRSKATASAAGAVGDHIKKMNPIV